MPLWPFNKKRRARRPSTQTEKPADAPISARPQPHHDTPAHEGLTNHSARHQPQSTENITALPFQARLQHSPHLRPIDSEKPQIPYNFRDHATSQTSVHHATDTRSPSRPATVRSKRSIYDNSIVRRRSSKKRPDNDRLREEEIRAMSATNTPVPKRAGDGIFRRDSKKRRNMKDSNVSLPYGESIHSMSTVPEQRGWELGIFDVLSPRPAIRLSGVPQHPGTGDYTQRPASQDPSYRAKEKEPVEGFNKKGQRIGGSADDMDASDLRMLMERDAKRRERRRKEQQEKLDRKLRARAGRDRADSNKKRREGEEVRREQDIKARVEEERRARQPLSPPTDVHPALRGQPKTENVASIGLGIGRSQQQEPVAENPFTDPLPSPAPEEHAETRRRLEMPGAFTPIVTPMEDPIVETAKEVKYSQHGMQTATPPLSPMYASQRTPTSPQPSSELRQERTTSLPEAPPGMATVLEERRTSEPRSIDFRRAGGWATLFRRSGTLKKQNGQKETAPETSFANTSRESMSRGPIPAHLLGGEPSPFQRNKTGTPTRTQSRFREDLPEMPMSPPDSRVQSFDVPDLPVGAAAIAASHRDRASPRPIDRSSVNNRNSDTEAGAAARFDTPVSPGGRREGIMSASLASVDSEGSWLASGGSLKRGSRSSQLSRSIGSLRTRPQEFVASYEDMGGRDKDAEYMARRSPSPDAQKQRPTQRRVSTHTVTGADEEEESILEESPAEGLATPFTMHGSVRRKPTLVHRDPIARSREGLLAEYATGEVATIEGGGKDEDFEPTTPGAESQVRRATSVSYGGRGHARKVSAGSAKLLDLPPSRRQSVSPVESKRASTSSLPKVA